MNRISQVIISSIVLQTSWQSVQANSEGQEKPEAKIKSAVALKLDRQSLERLPLENTLPAIMMLTPGAVKSDRALGDTVSFGGSSVAENAIYINGADITDTTSMINWSSVPVRFIGNIEINTAGVSPKYRGAAGGLVNISTITGTNEWNFETSLNQTIGSWKHMIRNSDNEFLINEASQTYATLVASGPIIPETLYVAALYNPRNVRSDYFLSDFNSIDKNADLNSQTSSDDAFWSLQLDWSIDDVTNMSWLSFSDQKTIAQKFVHSDYDRTQKKGGEHYIFNISTEIKGYGMDLVISSSKPTNSTFSDADEICPVIVDARDPEDTKRLGCWVNGISEKTISTQQTSRIELSKAWQNHNFTFGVEQKYLKTDFDEFYSGHIYYRYLTVPADTVFQGKYFKEEADINRIRIYENGGEFDDKYTGFYLSDSWAITPDLTAKLGLRHDSFNYGYVVYSQKDGKQPALSLSDNWQLKLGIEWNLSNHLLFYALYDRTALPISSSTMAYMLSYERFDESFYLLEGLNDDGTPIYEGSSLYGGYSYYDDYYDKRDFISKNLKATEQETFSVGVDSNFRNKWHLGANLIYKKLTQLVEDISITKGLATLGYYDRPNRYILANPGADIIVPHQIFGDRSSYGFLTIPPKQLGYPKPERNYTALTFTADKEWDGVWELHASYVWSQLKGHHEGLVSSYDNRGNRTFEYDFPNMVDGSRGLLPNDRTHQLKVYGAYHILENVSVGTNLSISSGRPLSKFGKSIPHDPDWPDYGHGHTYYQANGEFNPRGTAGRTDTLVNVDLNARYFTNFKGVDIELSLDVFNVFDANVVTYKEEQAELNIKGSPNPTYGQALAYQLPRRLQFTALFRF